MTTSRHAVGEMSFERATINLIHLYDLWTELPYDNREYPGGTYVPRHSKAARAERLRRDYDEGVDPIGDVLARWDNPEH